jgi:uncharacterized cupredoxin-like copper-binding protein
MVRRLIAYSLLAQAILVVSACSNSHESVAPIADNQGVVAKTDWSKSQSIDVGLSSFAFTPQNLTLTRNQPYKLHLANSSDDTHTFSSDTLFSAVAVQKLVRGTGESTSIPADGVSLAPHEQADLYIVPVNAGTYRIYCDEFMHDTMGMHGDVVIQ